MRSISRSLGATLMGLVLVVGKSASAQTSSREEIAGLRDWLRDSGTWRWLTDVYVAGNELWRVLALLGSIVAALLVGRVLRAIVSAVARRFETRSRHLAAVALQALARAVVFAAVVIGIAIGLEILRLHPRAAEFADLLVSILATTAIGYAGYCLLSVVDEWLRGMSQRTSSKLDDMLVPLVRTTLRWTIAILVLVQIATILSEKPATSIIAGLGVGALAIGLAAQDTIKNFFGSLMIFGDRPFEMGDQIMVDGNTGTIETVGFRSTRFRTPEGYLVTMPNGELANKTIINMSKRGSLLRRMNLSVPPQITPEKLKRALAILKEILDHHEGMPPTMPPRVFLNELTPLSVTVMYWYQPADWWKFVALNERVNLDILARFAAEGIPLTAGPPGPPPSAPSDAAAGKK